MKKQWIIIAWMVLLINPIYAAHYPDSVQQASKAEPRIEYGWNFEFYGGLGLSRFEYHQADHFVSPHVDTRIAFPAWDAGLSINYYFLPYMGIGAGLEFNSYANTAAVVRGWQVTRKDYQNDPYTLTATPYDISEAERISMLEVPIALRFRAMPGKVGFTGSVGLKLGFPMTYGYTLANKGYMDNIVEYPHWNLTIQDVPSVIEDAPITGKTGNNGSFRIINYGLYGEAGMLIQLSQRVDLALSVFANYYVNDVLDWHSSRELSFASSYKVGEYPAPFSGAYNGVMETNEVKELHPWSLGLKVGIQINANRTRSQREYDREQRRLKKAQQAEQPVDTAVTVIDTPVETPIETPAEHDTVEEDNWAQRREIAKAQIQHLADEYAIDLCKEFCGIDTLRKRDTIVVREPVVVQEQICDTVVTVVQQLDEMLSSAVIFFNLDDTVPILEPADILIRIADVLRRHPDQMIQVNGHACKLGKPAYNQRLALRRAQSVANRLRALGVNDNQMILSSLGADHPFRYNGAHTLTKDRRVEILPIDIEAEFDAISGDDEEIEETTMPMIGAPRIVGTTERVVPGTRLAQIARRHYGEPQYWVFIYEANQDKLSNPSDLPVGIELLIPDMKERLKGLTKEQALQEAARVKRTIVK